MTIERFNEVLTSTLKKCESILGTKANEYATEDRLHNFKRAAAMCNNTPEESLLGMMIKHIVSVWDYVERKSKGEQLTLSQWDEKIIDSINYLILLRALVVEGADE